jgi:hypothetical protein
MPQSKIGKNYTFDRPGNYRIRVQGFLDQSWSERLGGLRITTNSSKDQGPVTVLDGHVRDQAELTGVLNALYQRHLTLLLVERLYDDQRFQLPETKDHQHT